MLSSGEGLGRGRVLRWNFVVYSSRERYLETLSCGRKVGWDEELVRGKFSDKILFGNFI